MEKSIIDVHFNYFLKNGQSRRNMKVYNATDRHGQKLRVYKFSSEPLFESMKEKLQTLAEHPNFEKCLFSFFDRSTQGFEGYFVFERYQGLGFGQALRQITYPLQLFIVAELANSIKYLHHAGICHGGISQNCLYSNRLRIPVLAETLGGFFPGHSTNPAPEEVSFPERAFPGTDIWHLGNFLNLIDRKTRSLDNVIRDCQELSPEKRPLPERVNEMLRNLYADEAIRTAPEIGKQRLNTLIRTLGVGLFAFAGFYYLDYKNELRTKTAIQVRHQDLEYAKQDGQRTLFLGLNDPMVVAESEKKWTLGRLATALNGYYQKTVFIPLPSTQTELTLPGTPSKWDTVVGQNGFEWTVTTQGEIRIFPQGSDPNHLRFMEYKAP